MLGPGPHLIKKNLPGRCFTKVEKDSSKLVAVSSKKERNKETKLNKYSLKGTE